MKYVLYLLSIVILAGLNSGGLKPLAIAGVVPNLLLLAVISVSFDRENKDYLWFALVAGVFFDFFSTVPMGSFTIPFILVALMLRFFITNVAVYELSFKYILSLTVAAVLGYHGLFMAYYFIFSSMSGIPSLLSAKELLVKLPYQVAYNVVLLLPVYFGMLGVKKFSSKLSPRHYSY